MTRIPFFDPAKAVSFVDPENCLVKILYLLYSVLDQCSIDRCSSCGPPEDLPMRMTSPTCPESLARVILGGHFPLARQQEGASLTEDARVDGRESKKAAV